MGPGRHADAPWVDRLAGILGGNCEGEKKEEWKDRRKSEWERRKEREKEGVPPLSHLNKQTEGMDKDEHCAYRPTGCSCD